MKKILGDRPVHEDRWGVATAGHQASSRSADCPFVHEGMPQKAPWHGTWMDALFDVYVWAPAGQNTRTGSRSIMSQAKPQTEN